MYIVKIYPSIFVKQMTNIHLSIFFSSKSIEILHVLETHDILIY